MKRKREDLTYEEVSELLDYDPLTGNLVWKVSPGRAVSGDIAGYVWTNFKTGKKYRRVGIKGFIHSSHRLAFLLQTGRYPEDQIDHIDHNGLNNKWVNFREVTSSENHKNMTRRTDNTSGVTGVSWDKARTKWRAQIQVGGKSIYLGSFAQKKEAIAVRKAAEVKYGFHPNHGK